MDLPTPPAIDISPVLIAGIFLLAAGIGVLAKKKTAGILVGLILIAGGIFGIFQAFSFNASSLAGQTVFLVLLFVCMVLLVVYGGWIARLVGAIVAVLVYFHLKDITPPETVTGRILEFIAQGLLWVWNTIKGLLHIS